MPPGIGHELNWKTRSWWLRLQKPGLQPCLHTASSCVAPVCLFIRNYDPNFSSIRGALALLPHLFFFFYLNIDLDSAYNVLVKSLKHPGTGRLL